MFFFLHTSYHNLLCLVIVLFIVELCHVVVLLPDGIYDHDPFNNAIAAASPIISPEYPAPKIAIDLSFKKWSITGAPYNKILI